MLKFAFYILPNSLLLKFLKILRSNSQDESQTREINWRLMWMTMRLTSHKFKLDQTWDVNQVKLLTVLLSFLIATILTEVKDFFWVCLVPADFNKQIYGDCGTWSFFALSRKIGEKLLMISFFLFPPFQFSNPKKESKTCCFSNKIWS